jgi:hypothetical protein
VVDKLINENGFDMLKNQLAELVWGSFPIEHPANAIGAAGHQRQPSP